MPLFACYPGRAGPEPDPSYDVISFPNHDSYHKLKSFTKLSVYVNVDKEEIQSRNNLIKLSYVCVIYTS